VAVTPGGDGHRDKLGCMARVAITGASGLVGGNLAAELIASGHQVVAIRRPATRLAHLADLAIEWHDADLADTAGMTRAFAGAACVFHCAAQVSVRRQVSPAMTLTNVTGTANVVRAVAAAAVPRLVHTSSVVAVVI
jgi:nucleoside-diphosphate-sugar epimerase